MVRIPLTQGQATWVDDEDAERLLQNKWQAAWRPNTRSFYAVRTANVDGRRRLIPMHREIMGLSYRDGKEVDHENHDTLDNRKSNLRVCTRRQNATNRKDRSPYGAGVWRRGERYYAQAKVNGRRIYIGAFESPQAAQEAYKTFVRSL